MDYKDYYKILGVDRSASQKDIKSAYRKLTKKYHPDLNHGDKDAELKYRDVNEAYEVLGDPDKRSKYDQFGAQWKYVKDGKTPPYGAGGYQQGGFDFSDIFSQFSQGSQGGGAHFSSSTIWELLEALVAAVPGLKVLVEALVAAHQQANLWRLSLLLA